jgi:hypothetical protein
MKKLFAVLILICIALIAASFHYNGYRRTWRQIWNLQTYSLPFLDMRVITGSAESLAAGYDPRVNNFYDPLHREFNYPLIWYPILESGINSTWVIPLGIAAIVLFFAGLILFPGKLDFLSIFLLFLTAFSPAVMLGVERANVDLIFFFLVSLALVLAEISLPAAFLLLLIGVLFKIYPIFAAGALWSANRSKSIKYILAFAVSALLYFGIMYSDMQSIFKATPKDDYLSYGVNVLAVHFFKMYGADSSLFSVLLYVFAFIMGILILYCGVRKHGQYSSSDLRNERAFWVGAGIYIGTFLLGNNYDYRLMFLLFAIPQLTEWGFRSQPNSWAARVTFLAVAFACWYGVISGLSSILGTGVSEMVYYLNQLADWVLFAGLLYLFAASMPQWAVVDLRRLTPMRSFLNRR